MHSKKMIVDVLCTLLVSMFITGNETFQKVDTALLCLHRYHAKHFVVIVHELKSYGEIKLKSDRINALRKQYDLFLEEDKKRKERNEYILGKLDNIVYSNALVPVRTKANSITNRPSTMFHVPYQAQVPSIPTVQSVDVNHQLRQDIPVQNINETLIQEVSKKYILIPKLTATCINNYLQPTQPICNDNIIEDEKQAMITPKISNTQPPYSNSNTDWKSKYEILNILKKEEQENNPLEFLENSPQTNLRNTNEKVLADGENIIPKDVNYSTQYNELNELPEKDNSDEKLNNELRNDKDIPISLTTKPNQNVHVTGDNLADTVTNIDNELQKMRLDENNQIESSISNPLAEENIYVDNTDDYNYIEPNENTLGSEQMYYAEHLPTAEANLDQEYNCSETGQPTSGDNLTQYEEHFEPVHNPNINLEENLGDPGIQAFEQKYESENIEPELYLEEQNAESVQVMSTNNLMTEISNNISVTDSGDNDRAVYEPVDNNHTLQNNLKLKGSQDSTTEQVGIANPPDTTVEQHTPSEIVPEIKDNEETGDIVGIQDFNAEQSELFHSDHPAETYEYQQGDANTNYQEYGKGETYQENEDYPQNDNYPHSTNYYNGTLQRDVYPVEIEEDEENLKLRYDRSYPQQYIDPYESAYNKNPSDYQEAVADYHPVRTDYIEAIYDQKYCENPEQIEATMNHEDKFEEPAHEAVSQAEGNKTPDSK